VPLVSLNVLSVQHLATVLNVLTIKLQNLMVPFAKLVLKLALELSVLLVLLGTCVLLVPDQTFSHHQHLVLASPVPT